MKTLLKRILLAMMALMLLIPVAQADLDALTILQESQSYANIILEGRDSGSCGMLRGNIELTVVLVSTNDTSWNLNDLGTLEHCIDGAIADLQREASSHGVSLSITPVYYRATGSSDPDAAGWRNDVISSVPELRKRSNWEDRPVLFCLNVDGRSFARTGSSSMEYVVFYLERDAGTVRHELLHLFGAEDFYFHKDIEAAAERHFPDSVMLHSDDGAVTDPLTAYLVGWTSEPDAVASAFLEDISHLTEDDVEDARTKDQQSGFGAFELESGMYYGSLEMGCANGLGLHQWASGNTYVGNWTWNTLDGKGTFTWNDGEYYTGDFVGDARTGKGTYVWADGSSYTGDFVAGQRTGRGTLTWTNGDCYTGDFVAGKRTGKGTFTWADGSSYTGDFVGNAITGMGMMSCTNGDTYIGQFENGLFSGFGTMYYADGTVKTGLWANNAFTGE